MRTRTRKDAAEGPLDRGAYFNAAFRILAEGGAEALTVDSLCTRVGATKGSFYHHFSGTADFVSALMRCWNDSAEALMAELFAMVAAEGDPYRSFEVIFPKLAAGQPHEAEAALRAWGNTNPDVAAAVALYDANRERATAQFLANFIDDPARCRVLAHMAISMGNGMQQRTPIDRELMMEVALEFLRNNVGLQMEVERDEGDFRVKIRPPRARRTKRTG